MISFSAVGISQLSPLFCSFCCLFFSASPFCCLIVAQTIDFWVLALCSTILLRKFSGNTQSQQKVTQQQHKNCFKELLFFTLCVRVCVLGSVFVCVWVCLVWCAHLSNFYALFLCAVRNVRVCEWLWRVPKLVKREWLPLLPQSCWSAARLGKWVARVRGRNIALNHDQLGLLLWFLISQMADTSRIIGL